MWNCGNCYVICEKRWWNSQTKMQAKLVSKSNHLKNRVLKNFPFQGSFSVNVDRAINSLLSLQVLISVSNLLSNHHLFHVKCRDVHIYRLILWTWRTQTNPTSKKCLGLGGQIEWWPDSVWFLIIYVCVCVIFKWLFKFSYVTQWSAPDNPYLIRLSIKNSQKKAAWIQLVWTKFFPKLDPAQLSQS